MILVELRVELCNTRTQNTQKGTLSFLLIPPYPTLFLFLSHII